MIKTKDDIVINYTALRGQILVVYRLIHVYRPKPEMIINVTTIDNIFMSFHTENHELGNEIFDKLKSLIPKEAETNIGINEPNLDHVET